MRTLVCKGTTAGGIALASKGILDIAVEFFIKPARSLLLESCLGGELAKSCEATLNLVAKGETGTRLSIYSSINAKIRLDSYLKRE